ncbi:MAG: 4-(cytidine 5'-diphospho)-2-C-methyl-D-erythritol kinase [Planctomycetota bacterium]|nr:4-(cytidine 5'-diphospho)-2-C-methyl-D-erythritol kinase [Planctomycetota bacterium]
MADSVHILAPAKLNLALSVGPPGEDHMHPISSWMVTIDLEDEIELTRRKDPPLSLYGIQWHEDAVRKPEIDWPISSDLAARAHQALEDHVQRKLPVRMRISKRIPTGSGLGGGSADAAAVLRGINQLFGLRLEDDVLCKIGARLGSDIPFMIRGGSAIVEGVGGELEHHESVPELAAVLILPEAHCNTAQVYGWFDDLAEESPDEGGLRPERVRELVRGPLDPASPFNDLTESALRSAPELRSLRDEISAMAERPVHVTGSGAGLFVLCDEPIHAQALAKAITTGFGIPALAVNAVETPAPTSG